MPENLMPENIMTESATEATAPPRHVFLVDGSGFIFRAFFALPPMTRSDGTPVNAVYGFTNMLMKLLEDTDADHIAIIFDAKRENFRNEIYPDYKAHRPPAPDELVPQFALINEAVEAFGLPAIQMEGFEADDLIATYAKHAQEAGADVTVVSSDKDLMQLVSERVCMLDTMKNQVTGPDQVVEKFGVGPDKVVEVQALAGDSVDNVPGVPGIGPKIAAELINKYGDLESLLSHAEEIKQPKRRQNLIEFADQARISRRLVELRTDVPIETPLSAFAVKKPDPETLVGFMKAQGFKTIVNRIESQLVDSGDAEPAAVGDTSYELVQDEAALVRWIDEATAAGVVAFDTETTSLNGARAALVGVSLSVEPGSACYIPVAHKVLREQGALDFGADANSSDDGDEIKQIPLDRALALLKPMLEDSSVLKIGHNIKYDTLVLLKYDIRLTPVDDTMLMSFVLEGRASL